MVLNEPRDSNRNGPGPHPVTPRRLALLLLGIFLMLVAGVAMLQLFSLSAGTGSDFGPAVVPRVVIGLMLAVGSALVLQAAMARHGSGRRWPPWAIALIVAGGLAMNYRAILLLVGLAIGSVDLLVLGASGPLPQSIALTLGPPELVVVHLVQLAVGVSLACYGRLAAFGMVLFGLLLGLVGIDVVTGTLRFTFNQTWLLDGIGAFTMAAGLILVADALVAAASPTTWLRLTRHAVGLAPGGAVPLAPAIAMRVGGTVMIGLVALFTYWQNNEAAELLLLAGFAVVGIGLKLCGWNRWLAVAAFAISPVFEQTIRQAAVLGRGSLAYFADRPITVTLLAVVALMIAAMLVVAIVRFVRAPAEVGS